jgi:uncharacterized protein (TIGR02391 family)
MGRPRILDEKIMSKIAEKLGKDDITKINAMVSRKARKLGISAEAALILLAKDYGIGTATYQRRLDPTKQAEIRVASSTIRVSNSPKIQPGKPNNQRTANLNNKRAQLKSSIDSLIQDDELRNRCKNSLLANSNFDIAINQATLVLEERIRTKAVPTTRLVGENLVGYAFNEDPARTVLLVASGESDDQRGFTQIMRGVVPAFRNKTHHHITNTFSREEAMRVCGLVDVLLRVVDNSTKVR